MVSVCYATRQCSPKTFFRAQISGDEPGEFSSRKADDSARALVQHWFPTIYAISDPHPLAVLTGKNNPDGSPVNVGERTYSNSCTMKVSLCYGVSSLSL